MNILLIKSLSKKERIINIFTSIGMYTFKFIEELGSTQCRESRLYRTKEEAQRIASAHNVRNVFYNRKYR